VLAKTATVHFFGSAVPVWSSLIGVCGGVLALTRFLFGHRLSFLIVCGLLQVKAGIFLNYQIKKT
jgi:hypothetical protein